VYFLLALTSFVVFVQSLGRPSVSQSRSLRGSTWRRAGASSVVSDTLVSCQYDFCVCSLLPTLRHGTLVRRWRRAVKSLACCCICALVPYVLCSVAECVLDGDASVVYVDLRRASGVVKPACCLFKWADKRFCDAER